MSHAIPSTTSATKPLREFFDSDKCAQRRRIAANRDGVEAAPVRFLGADASSPVGVAPPISDREALDRINAGLKPGESLKPRDVYIHWIEAASSRFIGDRYAFLAESTLINIASAANLGVAFMNSHATGSLSGPPAQLPFGRTFYGAFEPADDANPSRTIVGFYMLAGVRPNGAAGPSTDDLHAAITAGTIFDVSVGLGGGEVLCGVCGQNWTEEAEIGDYDFCAHLPGSRHGMTPAEIEASAARGVTKGRATYVIHDATFSEVSAVYDGAVPGAGFSRLRTAMSKLSTNERDEIREAFGEIFPELADGGRMSKRKTRFEPVAEGEPDGDEKPETTTEDVPESEDPKADAPDPEAAPGDPMPPMPPHGEPDGDEEGDGEEKPPAEGEPDGDEEASELARLRRENALLKAGSFAGRFKDKLGAAANALAQQLHVALAGTPHQSAFEAFCAALPNLDLARTRVGAVQRDLVAEHTSPGSADQALHRAALRELASKGIRQGTPEWGKHYNDTITRLRVGQ